MRPTVAGHALHPTLTDSTSLSMLLSYQPPSIDNGCSWSDASWVADEFLTIMRICKGTKYFDRDEYQRAKAIIKECDNDCNWTDAAWVSETAYMEVMSQLMEDFKEPSSEEEPKSQDKPQEDDADDSSSDSQ